MTNRVGPPITRAILVQKALSDIARDSTPNDIRKRSVSERDNSPTCKRSRGPQMWSDRHRPSVLERLASPQKISASDSSPRSTAGNFCHDADKRFRHNSRPTHSRNWQYDSDTKEDHVYRSKSRPRSEDESDYFCSSDNRNYSRAHSRRNFHESSRWSDNHRMHDRRATRSAHTELNCIDMSDYRRRSDDHRPSPKMSKHQDVDEHSHTSALPPEKIDNSRKEASAKPDCCENPNKATAATEPGTRRLYDDKLSSRRKVELSHRKVVNEDRESHYRSREQSIRSHHSDENTKRSYEQRPPSYETSDWKRDTFKHHDSDNWKNRRTSRKEKHYHLASDPERKRSRPDGLLLDACKRGRSRKRYSGNERFTSEPVILPARASARKLYRQNEEKTKSRSGEIDESEEGLVNSDRGESMLDMLMFPDVGGSTGVSVNITHMINKGVGALMVLYEYLCLRILKFRCGVDAPWVRARIPRRVNVEKHPSSESWYVREFIGQNLIDKDRTQFWSFLEGDEVVDTETDDKQELYPQSLKSFLLDPSKVTEGQTERFEKLNDTFPYITRSLLWCLRPTNKAGKSSGEYTVELNADVINVWMSILQNHFDSHPSKHTQNKTLFLSTDFISTFEWNLTASVTPDVPKSETSSIYRILDRSQWQPGAPGRYAAENLRTKGSMEAACQKVYRFMMRRRLDVWSYDYICWPVNYFNSHWVLIVVNPKLRTLFWIDSYADCYNQAYDAYQKGRRRQPHGSVGGTVAEEVRELFGEAVVTEMMEDEAAGYSGWLHMYCVERYMKYDYIQRNPDTSPNAPLLSEPWNRVTVTGLPQQSITSLDCGVYAAQFARCVGLYGSPLICDFDNTRMSVLRASMACCVGLGKIPECPNEILEYCAQHNLNLESKTQSN